MRLLVGTSGFSYKEWKGSFYPADLPDAQMLRYYAERLPAVEINNTFYRMPTESLLGKWAAEVPEIRAFFDRFGGRLPPELSRTLDTLAHKLGVTASA